MKKLLALFAILMLLFTTTTALPVFAESNVPAGSTGITEWENNGINAPTFDFATKRK